MTDWIQLVARIVTQWLETAGVVISAVAWPIAVLCVLYVLRRPIVALIGRVRVLEALGITATIDETLDRAEKVGANLPEVPHGVKAKPAEPSALEAVVDAFPVVQITLAWRRVEAALAGLWEALYGHPTDVPMSPVMTRILMNDGGMDMVTLNTVEALREVANDAAHGRSQDGGPSKNQANRFAELARETADVISFRSDHLRAHGRGDDEENPQ